VKSRKQSAVQLNSFLFLLVSVLLVLVLISTAMLSGMYARFSTTAGGSDAARVAKFDIHKEGDLSSELSLEYVPGMTDSYTLIVTNRSEVAVSSTFTVKRLTNNLPLTLELDGERFSDSKSVSMDLAPNDAGTVTYTLTVSWPESANDAAYSYELDAIRVHVHAEQID